MANSNRRHRSESHNPSQRLSHVVWCSTEDALQASYESSRCLRCQDTPDELGIGDISCQNHDASEGGITNMRTASIRGADVGTLRERHNKSWLRASDGGDVKFQRDPWNAHRFLTVRVLYFFKHTINSGGVLHPRKGR